MSDASWLGYVRGYQTLVDDAGNTYPRRNRLRARGARVADALAADGTPETLLDLRSNASVLDLHDRFMSGNNTSGSIGALGWLLLGVGTPATSRSNGDGSGIRRIATSSSSSDLTALSLGDTATREIIAPSKVAILQFVVSSPGLSDRAHFVGLTEDCTDLAAPARALGFFYDDAESPNWHVWARDAGSGDPVDTGVILNAATTYVLTIHQHEFGSFRMYVNSTLVATLADDIPASACNVAAVTMTQAAAASQLDLLYFGMSGSSGLLSVP